MFKLERKPKYSDQEISIELRTVFGKEDEFGIDKTMRFFIYLLGCHKKIGYIDLRVGESEYLYYMGHIGYRIEEDYRGHHYAAKAVKLILNQAKEEKMKRVIITCSPENTASFKTCTYVKAKLLETVKVPEWHELYQRNEIDKCIFEIKIKGI